MGAVATGSRSRRTSGPGVGLVRAGAGTALVGSPETVAERLREYQEIGIETVIGSGYPHLEEAYRVAELLFPRSASARRSGVRRELRSTSSAGNGSSPAAASGRQPQRLSS